MTGRLARRALALYPLGFRRRYGEEMRALLDEQPPGPRALADLLKGALRAHLRPPATAAEAVGPADRIRLTSGGLLVCWVIFAAAGLGFYKTTEDQPFSVAGHAHPVLGAAHLVVQAAAVVGSLAVVLGALPLIVIALAQARSGVIRAIAPVALFLALTGALLAVGHAGGVVAIVWSLAGLGCGVACALACRATLFELDVDARWLRTALACGVVVAVAMAAIGVATAVYAVALLIDASSLAASPNGPLQVATAGGSVVGQAVIMALLTLCAAVTLRRGWGAYRTAARP